MFRILGIRDGDRRRLVERGFNGVFTVEPASIRKRPQSHAPALTPTKRLVRARSSTYCRALRRRWRRRAVAVRLLLVTAVAAVAAAAGSVSAGAVPAVGGCPSHFSLISATDLGVLLGLTEEEVLAIPSLDLNGDRMTCYTQLPNGRLAGLDNVLP
jgi:hypothetical protein